MPQLQLGRIMFVTSLLLVRCEGCLLILRLLLKHVFILTIWLFIYFNCPKIILYFSDRCSKLLLDFQYLINYHKKFAIQQLRKLILSLNFELSCIKRIEGESLRIHIFLFYSVIKMIIYPLLQNRQWFQKVWGALCHNIITKNFI